MPRIAEFMEEVAQVVERIPTTRTPANGFLRHRGNTAFRDSPAGGADGFAIALDSQVTIQGFGREEQKQVEAFVSVTIGHFPNGPDDERERSVAEDLERLVDVLEAKSDWGQGSGGAVDLVQCDTRGRTDRTENGWWFTPLLFRCVIWSPSWRA